MNRVVIAFAATLFAIGLTAPLLDPQETRYAHIPLEMADAGDWTIPRLRGQPYLDKPPLLYWLVGAAYAAVGPSDGAARTVPALAAVGTIAVTGWWGRRRFGPLGGFAAACVLALSPGFVYYARLLTFDGPLTLWVTVSLAAADVARLGRNKRAVWLISAGAAGLGVLTKGPVALVLTLPVICGWQFWEDGSASRWRAWVAWCIAALAVALPWFVAAEVREPGFLADFLWHHHVERYTSAFDHEEPAWFYLPILAVGLVPWLVFLPAVVTSRDARRYLFAGLWVVAFFSAGGCKRASYILPAYPLLAMGLGAYLAEPSRALMFRRLVVGTAVVVLLGVAFVWPDYARRFSMRDLLAAVPPSAEPLYCSPRLADSAGYYLGARKLVMLNSRREPAMGDVLLLANAERKAPADWTFDVIARHGRAAVVRLVSRQ